MINTKRGESETRRNSNSISVSQRFVLIIGYRKNQPKENPVKRLGCGAT